MSQGWRARVAAAIQSSRGLVIRETQSDPFAALRTHVPPVRLVGEGSDEARLEWHRVGGRPGAPLRDVLEDFLELATAPEREIATFAARYGSLLPITGGSDAGSVPAAGGKRDPQGEAVVSEPLGIWQLHARTLEALIGAAVDAAAGLPSREDWTHVLGVLAVPAWAHDRTSGSAPPSQQDLEAIAVKETIGGILDDAVSDEERGDRITRALLRLSGVEVAFEAGERGEPHRTYTTRASRIEMEGDEGWVLDGLLPVLACQTAMLCWAARTVIMVRCTGCGRFLHPSYFRQEGRRRPRKGQPFYGHHDDCARDARLQTKKDSRDRAKRGSQETR